MSTVLQEILGEFGCNILNYTKSKIIVDHFYNEERYNDFLKGINCRQGMGMFNIDEVVEFNKLNDNILVIVQKDGVEFARYKYIPIFKGLLEYKVVNSVGKKVNRYLTFKIRRNEYSSKINFIDTSRNYLEFSNIESVKEYLINKYEINKPIDWSAYVG